MHLNRSASLYPQIEDNKRGSRVDTKG
jgi:hypothetical protein